VHSFGVNNNVPFAKCFCEFNDVGVVFTKAAEFFFFINGNIAVAYQNYIGVNAHGAWVEEDAIGFENLLLF